MMSVGFTVGKALIHDHEMVSSSAIVYEDLQGLASQTPNPGPSDSQFGLSRVTLFQGKWHLSNSFTRLSETSPGFNNSLGDSLGQPKNHMGFSHNY